MILPLIQAPIVAPGRSVQSLEGKASGSWAGRLGAAACLGVVAQLFSLILHNRGGLSLHIYICMNTYICIDIYILCILY